MNENLKRPEQDSTDINNIIPDIADPLSSQNPIPLTGSPYEETHIPYISQPEESTQQTNTASEGDDEQEATSSSSSQSADLIR